jgi:hypothetical protein
LFRRDDCGGGANEAGLACMPFQRNLRLSMGLFWPEEKQQMADNKNSKEKQPGEHPEGEYHYNPGNQSGKTAKIVPKEEANENDEPHHDRS